MNNKLIIKSLVLLLVLAFMMGCSKSNEVSPSSLAGKWKQNGTTWKVTVNQNGKATTEDLSQAADNSILEIKADGTAILDGDAVTYKTSGSTITFTDGTNSLVYNIKVNGNSLTLSFTKDQFYQFLKDFYDTNDPDVADWATLKPLITDFIFDVNYVKQ
jgi:hypothetical protein